MKVSLLITLVRNMGKKGTAKVYRILVGSELDKRYASAFEGMRVEARDGKTILTGEVVDQPRLFGILQRLNGLRLELLSVEVLSDGAYPNVEATQTHGHDPGS
jgi:hypothetical protein